MRFFLKILFFIFTMISTVGEVHSSTGHDYSHIKCINRNGRIYDPMLGHFLSPDPYIQVPDNPLNFNRYAYALFNPLKYTDPSGYLFDEWNLNIHTGELDWVSSLGGKTTQYVNIVDDYNSYGTYSFPGNKLFVNWTNDMGFVNLSINGFSESGSWNSYYQQFFANDASFYIDGIGIPYTTYTAGIPYFDGYQSLASGRTDYSPFNVGDLIGIGSAVKGLASLASTAFSRVAAKTGTYSVYQGLDAAASIRYVGITSRDPAVRFAEHVASGTARSALGYEVINGATGLTRTQARIWEQTLINQYGLQKNGGLLFNKINSIAPKYWWQYSTKP